VYPAIGHRQIRTIRREKIKEIIAVMNRKGLSASRIAQAHLVINAVFNEAVRNKKLPESPCTDIAVPDIVHAADFVFPDDDELEALAAGLPVDWAATVWLMYGCGLRIGEALAVKKRCLFRPGTRPPISALVEFVDSHKDRFGGARPAITRAMPARRHRRDASRPARHAAVSARQRQLAPGSRIPRVSGPCAARPRAAARTAGCPGRRHTGRSAPKCTFDIPPAE
jgi:integrase